MTSVNLLGSGELKIVGTDNADHVVVSEVNDGFDIKVKVQGQPAQFFSAWQVNDISFKGNDGDDRFENKTSLDSKADGNAGKDTLIGGSGEDFLKGNGAKDLLRGGGGDDTLVGNGGNDVVKGEDGEDILHGGAGKDKMLGGNDEDKLYGGTGKDDMDGGADLDIMDGEEGNDVMVGGSATDWMVGGDGDDTMYGGSGDDFIVGGDGNDDLYGNDGADSLYGQAGADELWGGFFDGDVDELHGGGGPVDVFHNYEKWGGGWEDTIVDNGFWEPVYYHHLLDFSPGVDMELPEKVIG